ncbi:MAG: gamma-glutamyl-gamma-aminobutyrate hydrolase family protein [Pseudomonadota bacterium]|jgi:putative glutamine amidotransferase
MNKPTILVPAYVTKSAKTGETVAIGLGANYAEFLSRFGNVRIVMPHEEKVDGDLLFLPGGMDTNPINYGEVPSIFAGNIDVHKEFFFKERLKNYIDNTPIFGVCLGMQQLNVHFGGKLIQNLLFHAQSSDRWQTAHPIFPPTLEFDKLNDKQIKLLPKVNSHHHQAVLTNMCAESFTPLLLAEYEDKYLPGSHGNHNTCIVEAFVHNHLPIVGVQWHPEELYDEIAVSLMNILLNTKDISHEERIGIILGVIEDKF